MRCWGSEEIMISEKEKEIIIQCAKNRVFSKKNLHNIASCLFIEVVKLKLNIGFFYERFEK
jgi:hypothetical protein